MMLVVASPGFPARTKTRRNAVALSAEGRAAAEWMLAHPEKVAEIESTLTVADVGRRIPVPVTS